MTLEGEISLNQFAQAVRPIDDLVKSFSELSENEKRIFLQHLCGLIWQSKPVDSDIEFAINDSPLKPTFTPCVLLRTHRLIIGLQKIMKLPIDELNKSYILFLHLFKIAYSRRFEKEKGNRGKWWYADLANTEFIKSLLADRTIS